MVLHFDCRDLIHVRLDLTYVRVKRKENGHVYGGDSLKGVLLLVLLSSGNGVTEGPCCHKRSLNLI